MSALESLADTDEAAVRLLEAAGSDPEAQRALWELIEAEQLADPEETSPGTSSPPSSPGCSAPTPTVTTSGSQPSQEPSEQGPIAFHFAPNIQRMDTPREDGQAPTVMAGATPAVTPFVKRHATTGEDAETWAQAETSKPVTGHQATQPALSAGASAIRKLTPTECERLMGWPEGWTWLAPE